jgi:hypothetical protein
MEGPTSKKTKESPKKANQTNPKREKTRNKMEGPTSKKTKESPKKVNHKGHIEISNPLLSQEAYQIGKGEDLLKGP